jgi:hypothetical protein
MEQESNGNKRNFRRLLISKVTYRKMALSRRSIEKKVDLRIKCMDHMEGWTLCRPPFPHEIAKYIEKYLNTKAEKYEENTNEEKQ